jgi:hypothetical protein
MVNFHLFATSFSKSFLFLFLFVFFKLLNNYLIYLLLLNHYCVMEGIGKCFESLNFELVYYKVSTHECVLVSSRKLKPFVNVDK